MSGFAVKGNVYRSNMVVEGGRRDERRDARRPAPVDEDGPMTARTNKNVARLLFDNVISGGQLGLLDAIVSPDAVNHAYPAAVGPAAFQGLVEALRDAVWFPHATVLDLIGEDDKVIALWQLDGPGAGAPLGASSGGPADRTIVSVLTFRDDRISDYRVVGGGDGARSAVRIPAQAGRR
jgi:hypothetical protein